MLQFQSLIGLFILAALAWLLSEKRSAVKFKFVLAGFALQFVIAAALLKLPLGQKFFFFLNKGVIALQTACEAGTSFVFGYLGGGPLAFESTDPGATFIFAFRALPLILLISALSSLLFYWRITPLVVRGFSLVLQKGFNIGGALALSAAANIFVGMVEAPLLIRPYLKALTRGELFAVMTCGMATIAGTVMVLYGSVLNPVLPGAMGHILTASIISAPAAVMIAGIMVPPEGSKTSGDLTPPFRAKSTMDAITRGTTEGVSLLINIIAMLLVFIALVSLANQLLAILPHSGTEPLTLQGLLGYLMAPIVFLMGIPISESVTAGSLMGVKTVMNEFLAYLQLVALAPEALSERSRLIMTYGMCGFANFGSLGIMIGGLSTVVPERREEIVALGLKSIVSGTLAGCMTGAVVGVLM